ncbi:hypothetical protein ORK51_15125 [Stenotrophomonas rhizophila]|uniref:5-methylcytosine restriction system specificity protein McrC n=1 Tax=Stenotrophomonas rhizophila TaxID=216778 RepID=UPI00224B9F11|nr:hypothetical protein [Stenotrophomonas rhizophila]MCX2921511.1 hypothetical protein [Stenotrophomonas rhizophila]
MPKQLIIELRERGQASPIATSQLERSEALAELINLSRRGIIGVQPSNGFILVQPRNLVGLYESPSLVVRISPKSKELADSLLSLISDWRRSVIHKNPWGIASQDRGESLWSTFERLMSSMLREGTPWIYVRTERVSSTPRGSIDFTKTIKRLANRGIQHKVVTHRSERTALAELPSALLATKRCILRLEEPTPVVRRKIDQLVLSTGDHRAEISLEGARRIFQEAEALPNRPELKRLCAFCISALDQNPILQSEVIGQGIAEFTDLERTWETALQILLGQASGNLEHSAELHPLRSRQVLAFSNGGPEIDPDIICYYRGAPILVADAKYSVASSALASDLYQLSTYARRVGSSAGILIYVSSTEHSKIEAVGRLENGCALYAAYLSSSAFKPLACNPFSEIYGAIAGRQMSQH